MSNITDIVDAIFNSRGEDATQAIQSELASRAMNHIENLRTDVAASIFMPQQFETVPESVVDAQPDEGSTNEDI